MLVAPAALAFDRAGRLVVLDAQTHMLATLDAGGAVVRAVSLGPGWGAEIVYPATLRRAGADTWLVVDSDGDAAREVGADGAVLALRPVLPSGGRRVPTGSLAEELRPAPDGTWWTSDGTRLLRVDADGSVREALGGGVPEARLGLPGRPTIDAAGRRLCIDRATSSTHVWSADGAKLRVLVPERDDFGKGSPDFVVSVPEAHGGGYLVRGNDRRAVRFDANGARVGIEELATDFVAPLASGGAAWSWDFADDRVRLLGSGRRTSDSSVVIERLPDRRWLGRVDCAVALPDGGVAIVARGELALYGADGAPRGTHAMIRLATERARLVEAVSIAGGRALAETSGDETVLVDLDTARVRRLDLPQSYRAVALSPDGGEVWVFDVDRLVLYRYALP